MKLWKALGVAGLAGVAATGAIIARDRRRRAQLTPEEIRARLRQRVADSDPTGDSDPAGDPTPTGASHPTGGSADPGAQLGSTDSSARA